MGTAAAVAVGPGLLYVAKVGSAEPASASAAIPSATWIPVGYTEDGNLFNVEVTSEPVEVAEELDPIRYVNTRRTGNLDVNLAEINVQNFAIAFNGGTIGTPTGGYVTFEPPALGTEARLAVLWRGDGNAEQLIVRQALSSGAISIERRKSPAKATIPVSFRMEKPTAGTASFKYWGLSSLAYVDPHV